jgi:hypothetical protein
MECTTRVILFALVGAAMMGLISLSAGPPLKDLGPREETSAVAAGWWTWYCPTATNNTCPGCAGYSSCTVTAGRSCTHLGGSPGCSTPVAYKTCKWPAYNSCTNNKTIACGVSQVPDDCVPVMSGDLVERCDKPSPPCVAGGTSSCAPSGC